MWLKESIAKNNEMKDFVEYQKHDLILKNLKNRFYSIELFTNKT